MTYLSQGRIEGRDAAGRPTAGYDASDAAVAFGYASTLGPVQAGASLKYLRGRIASTQAQGLAADLGVKHAAGKLIVGAALRNLGPGLKYDDQRNDLPLRIAAGAAYQFTGGHAAAAEVVNGPRGAGTDASFGGEFQAAKGFFLRAGYTTRTAIAGGSSFDAARGLTMGLGARNDGWSLDYAILPSGELGRAHRFTLAARF